MFKNIISRFKLFYKFENKNSIINNYEIISENNKSIFIKISKKEIVNIEKRVLRKKHKEIFPL